MIATARLAPLPALRPHVQTAGLVVGLFALVGARWAGTRAGLDPLLVGVVFGLALLGLAASGRSLPRLGRPDERSARRLVALIGIGALPGLGLVGLALLAPAIATAPSFAGLGRPAAPFVPWALVIVLVAVAEEVILRGVLFGRLLEASGAAAAVVITSVVFALLHVPLYGWHVVPLDLGVGLALGGLRLVTRSVAAPAAAHAVADLATWWL